MIFLLSVLYIMPLKVATSIACGPIICLHAVTDMDVDNAVCYEEMGYVLNQEYVRVCNHTASPWKAFFKNDIVTRHMQAW